METFQKTPRKKLWEISPFYHCSVAGTCLSLDETRKILRKCGIPIPLYIRDYEIHGFAVTMSASKNEVSKKMHGFIEQKYGYYVKIFSEADDEAAIMSLWEDFLGQGNVAGAYWALMTHPSVSQENRDMAFGDVHMLSHINGASNRANIRDVEELKKKNEELGYTDKKNSALISEMRSRIKFLEENIELINRLRVDLKKAQDELLVLKSREDYLALKENEAKLIHECSRLSGINMEFETSLKTSEENIRRLSSENEKLRMESELKDEELVAMENNFISLLQRDPARCSECGLNNGGIDLCGKCILYVGGRPSVVNRCREMVEFYGGRFIHHDGGREESLSRLPDVFYRADFIFCPLDCVSHNACLSVKKMSQRHQKPFMLLKSSGLSSFLKGVTDISKVGFSETGAKLFQS